jgi:hypothetical protein
VKHIFENWRKFILEASSLDNSLKEGFYSAIMDSKFWQYPHKEEDVDLVDSTTFSTPAAEILMDALNNASNSLGVDIYFILSVTSDEEYTLEPDDEFGGYPNNWMMRGQYRGPERGKHIIWLELRPVGDQYKISDLDPEALSKKISLTINHELIHYEQLKKQAASKGISEEDAWEEMVSDSSQVSKSGERKDYLTSHIEVDAFAHEAAEELLNMYSKDEALELIKAGNGGGSGIVSDYISVVGDNPDEIKKFWKKLYTQINLQSDSIPEL